MSHLQRVSGIRLLENTPDLGSEPSVRSETNVDNKQQDQNSVARGWQCSVRAGIL